MKVVALAGGTGSAKILRGLDRLDVDLTVVANVGDNAWLYGVYVCPDIDIACYALAGISDRVKGWGIEGDTFQVLKMLGNLGAETWFSLGDRDLATCLLRTEMLHSGRTLTEATERERKLLGLDCRVLPVTDDPLETRIMTPGGEVHLQEFWVRDKGLPEVLGVRYKGSRRARVTAEVRSALKAADRVVICPANPVSSVGPMLSVPGFEGLLRGAERVAALSPMEGRAPFSGPAGKMMKATGSRQDSVGVATLYASFLDSLLISANDSGQHKEVEALGVRCILADTLISGPTDEVRLAKELLEA